EGMGRFTIDLDDKLADGWGRALACGQEQRLQCPYRGLGRAEVAQTVFARGQLVQAAGDVVGVTAREQHRMNGKRRGRDFRVVAVAVKGGLRSGRVPA